MDRLYNLNATTAVVVGDLMVDEYIMGTVTRVSPEAPIPILNFSNRRRVPGGAANVAMNLRSLGNRVEIIGVIGDDEIGCWLKGELSGAGIGTSGIVVDSDRPTTIKTRYTTLQQSMLRLDIEDSSPVSVKISSELANRLKCIVESMNVELVLVSDYIKGCLGDSQHENPLRYYLSEIAKRKGVVIGADTKRVGKQLSIFNGYTFVKPNLSELEKAIGATVESVGGLGPACDEYLRLTGAHNVLVTLGAQGMFHQGPDAAGPVPTVSASVYDVTGAGDTVFSVAGYGLFNGLNWSETMRLSNIAASVVVEHRGTKAITIEELELRIAATRSIQPAYFKH